MLKKLLEKQKLRLIVELFFLFLFGFLAFQDRIQLWLVFLVLGIILALGWGRFFCGWLCPMATVFRGINWLYKKLSIKRFRGSALLRKPWIRWLAFLVLLGIMIISRQTGREINLVLYIFALGIFLTLLFQESFWHRYLCPFGVPLSFTGGRTRNYLLVDEENCTNCGLCDRVCPGEAISHTEEGKRKIIKKECLVCMNCLPICPVKAIDWN